jgi:preprotein translocase subunit SecD
MRSRPLVWSLSTILFVAVVSVVATVLTGKAPLLGLDLKGGVSVVEQPQGRVTSGTLTEAQTIIDNRVNGLGVSNSNVTVQGKDIVIELPGAKNDTQVLKVVGETAQLFFRPEECLIAPYIAPTSHAKATPAKGHTQEGKTKAKAAARPAEGDKVTAPAPSGTYELNEANAELASLVHPAKAKATKAATAPQAPTGVPALAQSICNLSLAQQEAYKPPFSNQFGLTPASHDDPSSVVVLPYYADFNSKGQYHLDDRFVLGPANMSGSIVKSATATFNSNNDQWEVDLSFTGKGSAEFNKYASQYYSCYLQNTKNPPTALQCPPYGAIQAIELDATVESNPAIEAASFPGGATISGGSTGFTAQQAQDLATALNYGSLPVRFVAQSISNVSPQIGTDSLKDGAIAGAVAVLLVILYLLVYYRALGLVVVVGICISGALLYAITTLLSYTEGLALTLSGVIGLIVSVGVTADSCVVYFERLKEEIRSGRTVRTSVEKGFSRAFRTILAADFSSFIAALILYALTVGDVRGFAFFLGLATLLNVITTYFFTRPLVILIGRRAGVGRGRALGVGRGLGAGRLGARPAGAEA